MFWGTGVTAPLPEKLRGAGKADLLYTNSTLAINPDTGKMVWYFQHLPRDNWDLDHSFERMIVETKWPRVRTRCRGSTQGIRPGETRKVITGFPARPASSGRSTRKTGEFLWARPTVYQNVMRGSTCRPGGRSSTRTRRRSRSTSLSFACPYLLGGKNQPSGAYSPDTGAMYMPMNNTCMDIAMSVEKAGPSDGYGLSTKVRHVPGVDAATAPVGRLQAVSASTGKTLWTYQQRAPFYGSVLATGGNLVFSGDVVRRFRAFDAENGAVVWETILNGRSPGGR